jgi:hypothetical protein
MSDKAKALIKQAIEIHEKEDGASDYGKYRDIITEVLHLAYNDSKLRSGDKNALYRNALKDWVVEAGFNGFEEEVMGTEIERIAKIKEKRLPLYLTKEWETNEGSEYYLERLKGKDPQ